MNNLMETIVSYKDAIGNMTASDAENILKSYGNLALGAFKDLPEDGEGIMTKKELARRKLACSECNLRVNNTCVTTRSRDHVSEKSEDGSPVIVNGCGCGLAAKQFNINNHCPAGEW